MEDTASWARLPGSVGCWVLCSLLQCCRPQVKLGPFPNSEQEAVLGSGVAQEMGEAGLGPARSGGQDWALSLPEGWREQAQSCSGS